MVNVDELSPIEARAILNQMRLQRAYLQAKPGLEVAYVFYKVDKALEIIEEIEAAGEKVIVFTSLMGQPLPCRFYLPRPNARTRPHILATKAIAATSRNRSETLARVPSQPSLVQL